MHGAAQIDQLEISGHTFTILRLEHVHDYWRCQMVIDGELAPEFIEPCAHVEDMTHSEFVNYMKSQALGMLQYVRQERRAA